MDVLDDGECMPIEEGARVVSYQETLVCEPFGDRSESWSTWAELRDHAAFPAARTTVTEGVEVDVRAGRFVCTLYEVESEEEGTPITTSYWFARERAGPPVLVERSTLPWWRMELVEIR